MNWVLGIATVGLLAVVEIKMIKKLPRIRYCTTLYFLPLIVMGGRLAVRVVLNLWNMIEQ